MKLFFPLLLILLLANTACSNEYQLEDDLYACMSAKAKGEGINLDKEVDALEEQFINSGRLNSKSGQAKLEYLDTVIARGQISIPDGSGEHFRKVLSAYLLWHKCVEDGIKTPSNAKLVKLQEALHASVVKDGQVSPVQFANVLRKELSAKDLEHPFYRTMSLVLLGNVLFSSDTEYIRQIPKKLEDIPAPPPEVLEHATIIRSDSTGTMYLNDKPIALDDLTEALYPHAEQQTASDYCHFRIEVTPKTEYRIFVAINTAVEDVFIKLYANKSKEIFGKSYDQLSEEEVTKLEKRYPKRVLQVRPQ